MFQRLSKAGTVVVSVCFASLLQLPSFADSLAGSEGWTQAQTTTGNESGGFAPLYNGPNQAPQIQVAPKAGRARVEFTKQL